MNADCSGTVSERGFVWSSIAYLIIGFILLIKPGTALVTIVHILALLAAIMGVVSLVSYFRDKYSVGNGGVVKGIVYFVIAAFLYAGALIAVGRFLWRFFLFGAARKIQYEIRNDMFMHLEQMSVEYYNEHKTGDLMSRFINDLNSIRMAIGMAVISAFDATVMAVMVICQMIFYVDLKLTLLAIIPMIFIFAGEFYYGAIMEKRFKEKQEPPRYLPSDTQG